MLTVVFIERNGEKAGFSCEGHAGYAQEGEDIVCSAVSALTFNTANSIEAFTDDPLIVEHSEDGGYLSVLLKETISDRSKVLLDSLELGLKMIEETYGNDYLTIRTQDQIVTA